MEDKVEEKAVENKQADAIDVEAHNAAIAATIKPPNETYFLNEWEISYIRKNVCV